ncbi:hypothetical protein AR546_19285 [Leptospira interrogans serovar Canicola]|nr:hypothetical protein AR546_19285 [Leptospira interrogans serovar Canicola]POR17758.1 hypothetical protein B0T34_13760 [Leptospira interrogans serovar Canicola]
MFLTICSWMAFCLCYTTFEAFLRPLYYFGEVSFKNLILSDICGVGYGSLLCFLCQSLPQFYYIRPY